MRNFFQKILSVVICVHLAFGASVLSLANEEITLASDDTAQVAPTGVTVDYSKAYETKALFNALGFDVENANDMSQPASREQFVMLLMGLMNLRTPTPTTSQYEDVPSSTPLAAATTFANAIGVLSSSQKFNPAQAVDYAAACKMAVEAIGRRDEANAYGGYPYGYINVAERADLNDGLISQSTFTIGDMYVFLGNLSEAHVYNIVSCYDDSVSVNYLHSDGGTFLWNYHDIKIVEGIIDGANGAYLYDSIPVLEKGYVTINDERYTVAENNKIQLGIKVKAYVKNEGKAVENIVFITPYENEITQISHEYTPEFSDGKLIYYNENDKRISAGVDSEKAVLYNGRAFEEYTNTDFEINCGYIDAIDNDGDNKIDVISIWEPQYIEIGSVNVIDGIVYDANYLTNVATEGEEITFVSDLTVGDLGQGDVIEAFVSKDGKYVKIKLLENSISGVFDAIGSSNEIYINDTLYKTSEYFERFYMTKIKLGTEISVVLSDDGIVVSLSSTPASGFAYGYLDNIKKSSGLEQTIAIKFFSHRGEIEIANLEENIYLNERKISAFDAFASVADMLGNVFKYKKNADGKISAINLLSTEEGRYNPDTDGNAIKRYRFSGDDTTDTVHYRTSGKLAEAKAIITNSTVFFRIAEGTSDEDEKYTLYSRSRLTDFHGFTAENIELYNVDDESGVAEVFVWKTTSASSSDEVSERAPVGMVVTCNMALDDDSETAYRVLLYTGGKFTYYYIAADEKFIVNMNLAKDAVPYSVGDLIRFDSENKYIVNAVRVFNGTTRTLLDTETEYSPNHYYYGKLYSVSPTSIGILMDDGSVVYSPVNLTKAGYFNGADVDVVPVGLATTYKQVGDECTRVLVKCRYSLIEDDFNVFFVKP